MAIKIEIAYGTAIRNIQMSHHYYEMRDDELALEHALFAMENLTKVIEKLSE